ncbi:MAG: S41 family peptidase [Phycisphaerales bacterium]
MNPLTASRTSLVFLLVAMLAAFGCAPKRFTAEARADALAEIKYRVAASRDLGSHPGPRSASISPGFDDAVRDAPDSEEFRRALVRYIDQLNDGHAGVTAPDSSWRAIARASLTHLDGRAWLRCIPPADQSPTPTLQWFEVTEVDGYAYNRPGVVTELLHCPSPRNVVVRGRSASGEPVELPLSLAAESWGAGTFYLAGARDGAVMRQLPRAAYPAREDTPSIARAWKLGERGEVGYIWVSAMDGKGRSFATEVLCFLGIRPCRDRRDIQRAAHTLMDCESIIIDLQGNPGGSCHHAGQLVYELLPPSMPRVPFSHVDRGESLRGTHRWKVAPPAGRFSGRLVVLADDNTASAAEHVVACLKGVNSVTIIGARTAGAEFSQRSSNVGFGMKVYWGGLPTVWDPGFHSAEQHPVQPDIEVPLDAALLSDKGPVVAARDRRRRTVETSLRILGVDPAVFLLPKPPTDSAPSLGTESPLGQDQKGKITPP